MARPDSPYISVVPARSPVQDYFRQRFNGFDAAVVFQIHNKDGILACVGTASSTGQRCKRQITQRREEIMGICADFYAGVDVPAVRAAMIIWLAEDMLCRHNHANQFNDVVKKWTALMNTQLADV